MNRVIRRLVILFFIASCAAYAGVTLISRQNVDTGGPDITVDGDEITVSAALEPEEMESAVLEGVTASDKKDGDVTDSLIIESYTNFYDLENYKRDVTIDAFDNDGNVTKTTRTIIYSDYVSPEFSLSEPLRFSTTEGVDGLIANMTASDLLDGDVTENISMTGTDGTTVYASEGLYPVTIQVFNSAGDTSVINATLEFYDASSDAVTPKVLLSQYLVYVDKGSSFDPSSYIDGMELNYTDYSLEQMNNGEAPYSVSDVSINRNGLNTNTEGTYEVLYTMKGSGTSGSNIRLIVVVR